MAQDNDANDDTMTTTKAAIDHSAPLAEIETFFEGHEGDEAVLRYDSSYGGIVEMEVEVAYAEFAGATLYVGDDDHRIVNFNDVEKAIGDSVRKVGCDWEVEIVEEDNEQEVDEVNGEVQEFSDFEEQMEHCDFVDRSDTIKDYDGVEIFHVSFKQNTSEKIQYVDVDIDFVVKNGERAGLEHRETFQEDEFGTCTIWFDFPEDGEEKEEVDEVNGTKVGEEYEFDDNPELCTDGGIERECSVCGDVLSVVDVNESRRGSIHETETLRCQNGHTAKIHYDMFGHISSSWGVANLQKLVTDGGRDTVQYHSDTMSKEAFDRTFDPIVDVMECWNISFDEAEVFLEDAGYYGNPPTFVPDGGRELPPGEIDFNHGPPEDDDSDGGPEPHFATQEEYEFNERIYEDVKQSVIEAAEEHPFDPDTHTDRRHRSTVRTVAEGNLFGRLHSQDISGYGHSSLGAWLDNMTMAVTDPWEKTLDDRTHMRWVTSRGGEYRAVGVQRRPGGDWLVYLDKAECDIEMKKSDKQSACVMADQLRAENR